MERSVGRARIILAQGDITRFAVDAIVNAANSGLMGGGGVDGAIHRAGGPAILEECKAIVARQGTLSTGLAVITTGGNLPARHVIHTVGPVWHGGTQGESDLLASAYRESMTIAAEKNFTTIAFPSVSTGIYAYPVDKAAHIALDAVATALRTESSVREVTFVLFDSITLANYENALSRLDPARAGA